MSIVLKEMREDSFEKYLDKAIPAYASDNIESGRWPKEGAHERSRSDHERLLPDGIHTENNYLFDTYSNHDNCIVGFIWLSVEINSGVKSAFIYDIEIFEGYRRQGYAKLALSSVEEFVKELGIDKIGLHVFRQNISAQSLYEAAGYSVASSNMVKSLR